MKKIEVLGLQTVPEIKQGDNLPDGQGAVSGGRNHPGVGGGRFSPNPGSRGREVLRLVPEGKGNGLLTIRNPISILRGYAEMLLLHPKDNERVKRSADRIIGEADRLNRIASELLDYSRGEIRLNMQIIDLEGNNLVCC